MSDDVVRKENDELKIAIGETWNGFDFIKIKRYKRKRGFRVNLIHRTWRGKFVTLVSAEATNTREVIEKIKENLLPIFELPEDVVKEIEEFCNRSSTVKR